MQSLILHIHVGADGTLKLEIPIGIKNADMEVILVVNPTDRTSTAKATKIKRAKKWPPGFFEETFGSIPDFSLK